MMFMILQTVTPVAPFSWSNWFLDNILSMVGMIALGIWWLAKYRKLTDDLTKEVQALKNKLSDREKKLPETLGQEIKNVAERLAKHQESSTPHNSCPVHSASLESLKNEVRQGFADMKESVKGVRDAISKTDERLYNLIVENGRNPGASS